jgi:hypothetical protein
VPQKTDGKDRVKFNTLADNPSAMSAKSDKDVEM